LKPIEFSVPASFEKIEAILLNISQTDLFNVEPDQYRHSTPQRVTFRILIHPADSTRPKPVAILELTRKKDDITNLKISEQDPTQQNALPATGSPFTRFVSILSQHLVSMR